MTPVRAMALTSVATAAGASLIVAPADRLAIVAGMVAPLAAAALTWQIVERAHRQDPLAVMPAMLRAWAAKAAFFVAYVVLMMNGLALRPEPFVVSFTAYFVGLHVAEAVLFGRLFRRASRGVR
jgi:hypothetical protein